MKIVKADNYQTWYLENNNNAILIDPWLTNTLQQEGSFFIQRRKNNSADRIEGAGLRFQREIREKYLEIIDNFSDRCVLVDGNLGIDAISDIIWKEIRNRTSIEDD